LPIAGEPADAYSTLERAHRALAQSSYPKLLFTGNPGVLVSPTFAESFAKKLKNLRVVQLGAGRHYLQEDHAEVIGATINEWLIDLGIASGPKRKTDRIGISSDASRPQILHPEGGIARDALI
jgi:haloalkane dehalogenase